MSWIMRLVWLFVGRQLKNSFFNQAKRRGVMAYLQVLQTSRRIIVLALLAFVILQTMILAAFGALVTGFMLWDHDYQAKIQILFGIFAGLWILPMLAIFVIASERVWYKASGAQKMVEDLSRKKAA